LFLYIGKDVPALLLMGLFGVGQAAAIPITTDLPTLETPYNTQVTYLITYIRSQRPRFLHVNICRQGLDQANEARFANLLLEDSNFDNSSYVDYLISMHRYLIVFLTLIRSIQSEISKS
jgi:protein transport protein SEC24